MPALRRREGEGACSLYSLRAAQLSFHRKDDRKLIQIKGMNIRSGMMEPQRVGAGLAALGSIEGMTMATYRLYMLGDRHREIRSYKEFDAASDAEAIALADDLRGMDMGDLWSGGRRIKRFASFYKPAAASALSPLLQAAS
jgi:hypothetical protein